MTSIHGPCCEYQNCNIYNQQSQIVKSVTQVVQRVVFLHEDLVKLPSFPRKALEAELDLFEGGSIGKVAVVEVYFLALHIINVIY